MASEGPRWFVPCIWFPKENGSRSRQPFNNDTILLAVADEKLFRLLHNITAFLLNLFHLAWEWLLPTIIKVFRVLIFSIALTSHSSLVCLHAYNLIMVYESLLRYMKLRKPHGNTFRILPEQIFILLKKFKREMHFLLVLYHVTLKTYVNFWVLTFIRLKVFYLKFILPTCRF